MALNAQVIAQKSAHITKHQAENPASTYGAPANMLHNTHSTRTYTSPRKGSYRCNSPRFMSESRQFEFWPKTTDNETMLAPRHSVTLVEDKHAARQAVDSNVGAPATQPMRRSSSTASAPASRDTSSNSATTRRASDTIIRRNVLRNASSNTPSNHDPINSGKPRCTPTRSAVDPQVIYQQSAKCAEQEQQLRAPRTSLPSSPSVLSTIITSFLGLLTILQTSMSLMLVPAKCVLAACLSSQPPWSVSSPGTRPPSYRKSRQRLAGNSSDQLSSLSTEDMWAWEALSLDYNNFSV